MAYFTNTTQYKRNLFDFCFYIRIQYIIDVMKGTTSHSTNCEHNYLNEIRYSFISGLLQVKVKMGKTNRPTNERS